MSRRPDWLRSYPQVQRLLDTEGASLDYHPDADDTLPLLPPLPPLLRLRGEPDARMRLIARLLQGTFALLVLWMAVVVVGWMVLLGRWVLQYWH